MKLIKYTLSILTIVLALVACTKDDSANVIFNPADAKSGNLATPAAIILADATKGNDLPAFTWTKSDFGFNAAVNYVIEIALEGSNFTKSRIIGAVSNNNLIVKQQELQSALEKLGVILGTKANIEMRVKSQVVDQLNPIVSNVVKFNVTTFKPAEKQYPRVWIIGDYCGWNHSKSQFLYDINEDGKYFEGWIAFNGKAQNGFKITYTGGWNGDDIGSNDAAVIGNKIKVEPGSDIKLFNGIIMYLKLDNRDKNNRTLESVKTLSRIGLIGSATPNEWNSPDTELLFNENTNKFEAVVTLKDGEIKFRADNDWGLNWGKFDASEGKNPDQLNPNGGNIQVSAGKYKVVFSLNKVVPTYELIQL